MVTAELAASLPVLMVLLGVALSAVSVAGQRVRAADAAREAARAAARGDSGAAARLATQAAPGAAVTISRSGDRVVAQVRIAVHPMGGWLPALQVVERAVAAAEPDGQSAPPDGQSGLPP
ncbi:MAG TPA: TadE family type IV pilus minor pilin [Jatrophihabitantaceae bacterium]